MNIEYLGASLDFREFLKFELHSRQKRNPKYSLRSFARDLHISASRLSEILSGGQMSLAKAKDVASTLKLSKDDSDYFVALVGLSSPTKINSRKNFEATIKNYLKQKSEYSQVPLDTFAYISDWYHLALLSLIALPNAPASSQEFAKKLGITPIEVEVALERLERLGFISKQGHRYDVLQSRTMTTHDIPSSAIRKFHRDLLKKGADSLEERKVSERVAISSILSVPPENMEAAKEFLINMRQEFARKFEANGENCEVFAFSFVFFPLTGKG